MDRFADLIGGIIAVLVSIMLPIVVMMWLGSASCHSKAAGLRLEATWGPFQGCLVMRQDGVIVPIENYGRADRD